MAEYQRFADLGQGHAGLLTYIPRDDSERRPGYLHSTRLTVDAPHLKIVGSSAELYPPSKTATSEDAAHSFQGRLAQKRWLLKSHPETFIGGGAALSDCLSEAMVRFEKTEGRSNYGPLLAVGEMTDMSLIKIQTSMPLLAVVTGDSGEQLRLARLEHTRWQWNTDPHAFLNLEVIDPMYQHEEETIWTGSGLPISQIKFATSYSQSSACRWLLVQTLTSITVLQPEYHRAPRVGSANATSHSVQRPSCISPNPVATLQHSQTGGNAFSDVCFSPPSHNRPPQISVIDECGYWSIWNIVGRWQGVRKTLRLSLYKCGHMFEGSLTIIPRPSAYMAQKYGMLQVSRADHDKRTPNYNLRPDSDVNDLAESHQQLLLWDSKRIALLGLETDTVSANIDVVPQSRTHPDQILDIQSSSTNTNHVFVLTARRIIWLDLLPADSETNGVAPKVLLTCLHVGFGNEGLKMSVSRVSENDVDGSMVLLYSSDTDQLTTYWFSFPLEVNLPQWHRHTTSLHGHGSASPLSKTQFIRVHPAKLEVVDSPGAPGLGVQYARKGTKFYQTTMVGEDLSVRYCICTTSADAALEVTFPTIRVGWSKSAKRRRWKRRRRHCLRHFGDAFVMADDMTDTMIQRFLAQQGVKPRDQEHTSTSPVILETKSRPSLLKYNMILETLASQLEAAVSNGAFGLPTQLPEAIQTAIDGGAEDGMLPLTSWLEIMSTFEQPVLCEDPDEGLESVVEGLLGKTDGHIIVTQLRRRFINELPNSLIGFPFLKDHMSELWLGLTKEPLSEDTQRIRRIWVCEVARDIFFSSYGIMVQSVPVLGPSEPLIVSQGESHPQSSENQRPKILSSSPAPASSATTDTLNSAFERLRILAPTLEPGPLGALKAPQVLSLWPTERGVDPRDYISSVAVATDEKFSHAKQRLQKIEAKRKAQMEKYRRPAFMRQGFPASDGLSENAFTPEIRPPRPPPVHAMSSQQRGPDSSQGQGFVGPPVTMSQPVAGAFGDRKKVKKGRRKSGFR